MAMVRRRESMAYLPFGALDTHPIHPFSLFKPHFHSIELYLFSFKGNHRRGKRNEDSRGLPPPAQPIFHFLVPFPHLYRNLSRSHGVCAMN